MAPASSTSYSGVSDKRNRKGVFISYSRKDGAAFAKKLRQRLQKEGFLLWQDRVGLEGGRDWWLQIVDALNHVEYMALVMTPEALKSPIIKKEWRYARQQGVCVFPVKGVPDEEPDYASIPRWMSSVHFVETSDPDEWQKFLNDLRRTCRIPRVPFMVEDLAEDFVERPQEFEQLISKLLDVEREEPVAITAALRGAGGYGKTTLARALCHDERIQEAFDDGILWVTLGENPGNLTPKVIDLIEVLSGERPGFAELQPAVARLTELLADRDILLVIDDLWNAAHARPFLQGGKRCARLITTRNSDTLPPAAARIDLDAMQQNEALKLLGAGLPPGSEKVLETLASRLGEWPLLLKLTNSQLRIRVNEHQQSLNDALSYVNKALDKRGLTAFDARDAAERSQAVSKTLEISLELLSEDEHTRYAELAIFPEDINIPLATVEKLWQPAGLDDFATEDLCQRFYRLSLLLQLDLQTRTLRLHDVLRTYLKEQQRETLPNTHTRFLQAYKLKNWWELPPEEPYLWEHLAYHLKESGQRETLRDLLLDYRWLDKKLVVKSLSALLIDYDFLPENRELKLLHAALRLSAPLLSRNPGHLPGQLWGRLAFQTHPGITGLLQGVVKFKKNLWLRPLTASLVRAGGWLQLTLEGHSDFVNAVAITPDGRAAVSASWDNILKVWDLNSGALRHSLKGHSDFVNAVAITPDGQSAVSASSDNTLKVWDLNSGALRHSLEGHSSSVTAVVITPNGQSAVSASSDNTLKVWDLNSGALRHSLEGHSDSVNAVAICPDGQAAVSASWDNTLKVWDLNSGVLRHSLEGHSDFVTAVAITPDGQTAVSASDDDTLKVWDLNSGTLSYSLEGHSGSVIAVAITPDGQEAVSASSDKTLKVWDLNNGALRHTLEGHRSLVNAVAITPDGQEAVSASSDNTLKVWDLNSGALRHNLEGHDLPVTAVAVTPDGRAAVSASDDYTLKVWDLNNEALRHSLESHSDSVWAVAITSDGRAAVSASWDNTLKVWDLNSGNLRHSLEGHSDSVNAVAITPDGRAVVSASSDNTLKIWDLDSGDLRHTLEGHSGRVIAVAICPDGQVAVSASSDKTLRVWDLNSGALRHSLEGHGSSVTTMVISPNGQTVVSASENSTLNIWDLNSGVLHHSLEGPSYSVGAVAITPDGQTAVSASDDNTLEVWDLKSGVLRHSLENYSNSGSAVAITPDGQTAVSVSSDKTLKVWDLNSGTLRHSSEGHSDFANAMVISPNGQTLVTAFDDRTLKVRDISTGKEIAQFIGESAIWCCAIAPDGKTIVAGEASGRVHFLRLEGVEVKSKK